MCGCGVRAVCGDGVGGRFCPQTLYPEELSDGEGREWLGRVYPRASTLCLPNVTVPPAPHTPHPGPSGRPVRNGTEPESEARMRRGTRAGSRGLGPAPPPPTRHGLGPVRARLVRARTRRMSYRAGPRHEPRASWAPLRSALTSPPPAPRAHSPRPRRMPAGPAAVGVARSAGSGLRFAESEADQSALFASHRSVCSIFAAGSSQSLTVGAAAVADGQGAPALLRAARAGVLRPALDLRRRRAAVAAHRRRRRAGGPPRPALPVTPPCFSLPLSPTIPATHSHVQYPSPSRHHPYSTR